MRCERDCLEQGIWHPVLELRHESKPGMKAPAILDMLVCDKCRAISTPEDFISEEGWAQISAGVVNAGYPMPTRKLTTLAWMSAQECAAVWARSGMTKRVDGE